jgi:hypothetical protein
MPAPLCSEIRTTASNYVLQCLQGLKDAFWQFGRPWPPLAIPATRATARHEVAVARPYACRGGELQGLGSQLKCVGRVLR